MQLEQRIKKFMQTGKKDFFNIVILSCVLSVFKENYLKRPLFRVVLKRQVLNLSSSNVWCPFSSTIRFIWEVWEGVPQQVDRKLKVRNEWHSSLFYAIRTISISPKVMEQCSHSWLDVSQPSVLVEKRWGCCRQAQLAPVQSKHTMLTQDKRKPHTLMERCRSTLTVLGI